MREGAKVMHSRMRARTARPERFCILLGLLERPSQMDTKKTRGCGATSRNARAQNVHVKMRCSRHWM
jgi:hypothetical protein